MDFVGKFPCELSRIIFRFLDAYTLGACSQVSSTWRSLVNDDSLWRPLLLEDGMETEILLPLPDFPENTSALEEECRYKRFYGRGAMAIVHLKNNSVNKRQLEESSVAPLANGAILAAVSSRLYEPSVHVYDISKNLERIQTVAIPRIKCSLQLVYSSPEYLILEHFPAAWVCYKLVKGKLTFFGIAYTIGEEEHDVELKIDKEFDEKRQYSTFGISLIKLIDDTMILKSPTNDLYFVTLDPFEVKKKIDFEEVYRYSTVVVNNQLFLTNEESIACYDKYGRKKVTIESVVDRRWGRGLEANDNLIIQCLHLGHGGAGRERVLVLKIWGWNAKRLGKDITMTTPHPPLLALHPKSDVLIHCQGSDILATRLPSATLVWRMSLGTPDLSPANQLSLIPPHFFLLRTNDDYSLLDADSGNCIFTNKERAECGHVYRHQNPRAFVFYDALFSRIILHLFNQTAE